MNYVEFKHILEQQILTVKGGLKSSHTKNNYAKIKNEFPEWYEYVISNTQQLDTELIKEKIYCLYKGIEEIPKCPVCGNTIQFQHFMMPYRKVCSPQCAIKIREYNYSKFSDSISETNEKYLAIVNEWLSCPQETIVNEYVPYTNIIGLGYLLKNKSNLFYLLWKTKEVIKLPNNIQKPSDLEIKLRQYHLLNDIKEIPKCKFCGDNARFYNGNKGYSETCDSRECEKKRTRESRRNTTRNKLQNNLIGYTIIEGYTDRYTPIKIKHDECGHEFYYNCWNGSHVSHHFLCPNCYGGSSEESQVAEYLDELGVDYITNNKKILNGLELDVVIPKHNLAIEYDGLYWHSEASGKDKNYHLNKTKRCEEQGIQLLHVFSYEWNVKRDIVKSIIASKLGIYHNKYYGRKCVVKEIDTKTKNQFLEKNHIQGADKSKYKLGLYYDEELVSVMTFGKRSLGKGDSKLELIRFCNKLNCTVIGGASKLFKYFLGNYEVECDITTYCDRRYSVGGFYDKLGFTYSHTSQPSYYYFRNDLEMINRNRMMKHKMSAILENFDSNLTEVENARNNKYNRIWDCGTHVYKYHIR